MPRRLARPLLEDMAAFALEATEFLDERTGDELMADRMRFLAITRAAEIVGEAASHVRKPIQERFTDIDFASAIAMRHRLVHGYGAIDATILADTVRTDFPPLVSAALSSLLPDEET